MQFKYYWNGKTRKGSINQMLCEVKGKRALKKRPTDKHTNYRKQLMKHADKLKG